MLSILAHLLRRFVLLILGFLTASTPLTAQPSGLDEKTRVAVEALYRLEGIDISQNQALQTAVLNLVNATKGSPDFVKLVNKFKLPGHNQELLNFAIHHPSDEIGVLAMTMVLNSPNPAPLPEMVHGTNQVQASRALQAMGNTANKKAVPILATVSTNLALQTSTRKQAVHSLCRTREGATSLLHSIKNSELPEDLSFTASADLAALRWTDLRELAAQILPPPQGQDAKPLPPLTELLKRSGNPAKGAQVFKREGPNCATCHRINGLGTDVGPDLSEIGTKLGKDALYEAILAPSAGVSFGYEAHELELDSGEEAYGLIVSETKSEIVIKDTRGIITRHQKSAIVERRQMSLSIMPSGLQLTMSTEDLIDLVEFLASLRKQ